MLELGATKGVAMIDWTRASELLEDFGEDDFADLVDAFLEEVREGLAQLEVAQSAEEHRAAFHFLKGAALNIGFAEISGICERGERAAVTGGDLKTPKQLVMARMPDTATDFARQWRERLSVSL